MGKLVNPRASHLSPARLAALLACIPDAEWEEPDLGLSARLEGIAHTRYLRAALNLPPVPDDPRTGDLVVAAAPDGQVIARVYARPIPGGPDHKMPRHQVWLWRRYPAGTEHEAIALSAAELRKVRVAPGVIVRVDGETEATAPTRPVRAGRADLVKLPTVAELERRKAAVIKATQAQVARLDAQIEAARALDAAEARRAEAEAEATSARERAMTLLTGGAS